MQLDCMFAGRPVAAGAIIAGGMVRCSVMGKGGRACVLSEKVSAIGYIAAVTSRHAARPVDEVRPPQHWQMRLAHVIIAAASATLALRQTIRDRWQWRHDTIGIGGSAVTIDLLSCEPPSAELLRIFADYDVLCCGLYDAMLPLYHASRTDSRFFMRKCCLPHTHLYIPHCTCRYALVAPVADVIEDMRETAR